MKKFIAITTAIASLAVSNPAMAQSTDRDTQFLNLLDSVLIRNANPLRNTVSNQGKIDDGVSICQVLDDGTSIENLTREIVMDAMERYPREIDRQRAVNYGGIVISVAINVYCPEHNVQLQEYINR